MSYKIERAEIWGGEVPAHPGALARVLDLLRQGGGNLEAAVLRPVSPLSDTGVLFVTPIVGEKQAAAARRAGLHRTRSIHSVRVVGPDRPGLLADIAQMLNGMGLHICGLSSAGTNAHSVHYLRFTCAADADRAVEVLRQQLT